MTTQTTPTTTAPATRTLLDRAQVMNLLNAIGEAVQTAESDFAGAPWQVLAISYADLEHTLGKERAQRMNLAVRILTTLGRHPHRVEMVDRAARAVYDVLEQPSLVAEAKKLGIELRNEDGIPSHVLRQLIGRRQAEKREFTRRTNDLYQQERTKLLGRGCDPRRLATLMQDCERKVSQEMAREARERHEQRQERKPQPAPVVIVAPATEAPVRQQRPNGKKARKAQKAAEAPATEQAPAPQE